ncbi:hypothetical protein [Leptospira adleri]|uniref:Uncharacterized protein n=1 Tax=Leptospira adleri TaxID=2023186 RepID=A0A2M9YJA8_9LEPT|nr:hypothetical protein [Leptospira adleri]PJZ51631.1 hypothetical protein CH380_19495 [Leptospira adleri]PJZ61860.1 hypothetical protein CH376_10670 [Leptospira adleri]
MKNLFLKITLLLCISLLIPTCKRDHKEDDQNDPISSSILYGAFVRMDTLLRVENLTSAPVAVKIYDNSTCNASSTAVNSGMPSFYDFGTLAANSKSNFYPLPFSSNLQYNEVTMYVQFTGPCNFPLPNKLKAGSLSNLRGYLLQIKPATGGSANYLDIEERNGIFAYPPL